MCCPLPPRTMFLHSLYNTHLFLKFRLQDSITTMLSLPLKRAAVVGDLSRSIKARQQLGHVARSTLGSHMPSQEAFQEIIPRGTRCCLLLSSQTVRQGSHPCTQLVLQQCQSWASGGMVGRDPPSEHLGIHLMKDGP